MKKLIRPILGLILLMFSFYYTEKSIIFIREIDPIMREIKQNNKEAIKTINAKINDNRIVPGLNGQIVNTKESYSKMKSYGTYNEALTVFQEVKPTVSIDDNFDKFIENGNDIYQNIAIVMTIEKDSNPKELIEILKNKNIPYTIFIDGVFLGKNKTFIKDNLTTNTEFEPLSYDNKYEDLYFSTTISQIELETSKEVKYCYAEYDNSKILNLCSKKKIHTIIPTIKTTSHPYQEIKSKIKNGSIISLSNNSETKKELNTIIDYLRQKGYKFKKLEDLLSESLEEK